MSTVPERLFEAARPPNHQRDTKVNTTAPLDRLSTGLAVLEEIEQWVLTVEPSAERTIRYDMPTWPINGTPLVHAAAWKQHVSLHAVPPEGDLALDADLAPYAGAKGTLKMPYANIDYDLIERVVRRLLEKR